jgi:hypothetical protein
LRVQRDGRRFTVRLRGRRFRRGVGRRQRRSTSTRRPSATATQFGDRVHWQDHTTIAPAVEQSSAVAIKGRARHSEPFFWGQECVSAQLGSPVSKASLAFLAISSSASRPGIAKWSQSRGEHLLVAPQGAEPRSRSRSDGPASRPSESVVRLTPPLSPSAALWRTWLLSRCATRKNHHSCSRGGPCGHWSSISGSGPYRRGGRSTAWCRRCRTGRRAPCAPPWCRRRSSAGGRPATDSVAVAPAKDHVTPPGSRGRCGDPCDSPC